MKGFSVKRASGITSVKRKISKSTGIPLSKSGRKRKVKRMATGGCCLLPVVAFALFCVTVSLLILI